MNRFWRFGNPGFHFNFRPFGFMFHGPWARPDKKEYLKWLESYREELQKEMEAVDQEISDLKKD